MKAGKKPAMFGILKFSQGTIEIGLRVVVISFGIAALVAAAIALNQTEGNEQLTEQVDATQLAIDRGLPVLESQRAIVENYNGTIAAGGVIIAFAGITIISETVMIVVRLLNGCRTKINLLLTLDIILSTFLTFGYLGGGITASFYAAEWDDFTSDTIDKILTSLAVAAAFSFASVILCAVLAVWMALFICYHWNEKLVA